MAKTEKNRRQKVSQSRRGQQTSDDEIFWQLTIGIKVRELRDALRIKQTSLAKAAVVSQPHLSLIEKGKRPASIPTLARISQKLGIPLSLLIAMCERNMPKETASPQIRLLERRVSKELLAEVNAQFDRALPTEEEERRLGLFF